MLVKSKPTLVVTKWDKSQSRDNFLDFTRICIVPAMMLAN